MLRLVNSPNALLSMIVRFMNSKGDSSCIELINNLIDESSTSQLVPAFAFLGSWLATNIKNSNDPHYRTILQSAYKLVGKISLKVPPIILSNGVFDLNWGMYQPHWTLYQFYEPINDRILQLRSYVKPFSIYGQLILFPNTYSLHHEFSPATGMMIELEVDPEYQIACLAHFKRLLLNHAPSDAFKPILSRHNGRATLTRAIIDLLRELNEVKEATHCQLIFAFSSLFLYINSFTQSNDIDGQMLCEFLQSRPYLSPFCILAMINHVPINLYLFNLLTPREIAQNIEQQTDIQSSQYIMVDLTSCNTLKQFISKIPLILSNYFLTINPTGETENCNKIDDNEFLSFIHLSSATLYNKMKAVLSIARERQLGPLHVSSMGILLLRCIIFSLQRTLSDCAETKMFTKDFCHFVKTVFSILSPTQASQLGQKFFGANEAQASKVNADLTIRGALSHLVPVILHNTVNDQIIRYCSIAAKDAKLHKNAIMLITKLLISAPPKLTPEVFSILVKSDDIYMLIEYIIAINSNMSLHSLEEYKTMEDQKNKLINRLPLRIICGQPLVTIETGLNQDITPYTEFSQFIMRIFDQMAPHSCVSDLIRALKTQKDNESTILLMFGMSSYMSDKSFASLICSQLLEMYRDNTYSEDGQCKFEIRRCDYALIVSQTVLGRLLFFHFDDLAERLLDAMAEMIEHDTTPLRWIYNFLIQYRPYLTNSIRSRLDVIVSHLRYADEMYIKGSEHDLVYLVAQSLVKNDYVLIQDPDMVNSEFQSPYAHAEAFAYCSLLIPNYSDDQLIAMMLSPIFQIEKAWAKRDSACLSIAKLAGNVSKDLSIKFFSHIIKHKKTELGIIAGRMFLLTCRIDVFKEICIHTKDMIGKSNGKLDYFMRMAMPSFQRLKGDEQTTTSMLCAFLESVSDRTPKVLQESVIDAVGLVYSQLKLYNSRTKLINSSMTFTPELRSIFASSLDVDSPQAKIIKPNPIIPPQRSEIKRTKKRNRKTNYI